MEQTEVDTNKSQKDKLLEANINEILSEFDTYPPQHYQQLQNTLYESIEQRNLEGLVHLIIRGLDDRDNNVTVARINNETLDWLKNQPVGDEIIQACKKRFENGISSKPSLIEAYLHTLRPEDQVIYDSEYNEKFSPETQIKKIQEIISSPESKQLFFDYLINKVEDTTFENRGKEIENYITEKYGDKKISIIDVGCSSGQITERIAQYFPNAKITGIDLEKIGGDLSKAANANYLQGDAFNLPIQDDSMDVIVSLNTFRHFNNIGKAKALFNFAKVLKNEGIILIGPLFQKDQGINYNGGVSPQWGNRANRMDFIIEQDSFEGIKVFQKKNGKLIKTDFIHSEVM